MPPDIVGRSSTWVTNTLAHYPFQTHLHSYLSSTLSTPPISLSGSSYASSSSFVSTNHEAGSSVGSYGFNRANLATSPRILRNSFPTSLESPSNQLPQPGPKTNSAPLSLATMVANATVATTAAQPARSSTPTSNHPQLVNFLATLFPYHATRVLSLAHLLEIVIPHAPPIVGAMIDLPPTPIPSRSSRLKVEAGRTVYLHLPPFNAPVKDARTHNDVGKREHFNVDIRDHLTSLLDLVSESLNASELVLVLKRDERGDEELRELLHALAYVGGGVLRRVKGGFEFDERGWVLVGIEV